MLGTVLSTSSPLSRLVPRSPNPATGLFLGWIENLTQLRQKSRLWSDDGTSEAHFYLRHTMRWRFSVIKLWTYTISNFTVGLCKTRAIHRGSPRDSNKSSLGSCIMKSRLRVVQKIFKIWTGDETNKDCLVILMSNDDYISLFDWVERRLTNKNKL